MTDIESGGLLLLANLNGLADNMRLAHAHLCQAHLACCNSAVLLGQLRSAFARGRMRDKAKPAEGCATSKVRSSC